MAHIFPFFIRCINWAIKQTEWYKSYVWGGSTKFWSHNQFQLDVVNLGSGAGVNAFVYDNLTIKGANWALGPQSLLHDFNILKNYFSYISEGGIVIITICPFSGLAVDYNKKHNFKYYSFLHPATILNFEEKERLKALSLRHNPIKEISLYNIIHIVRVAIINQLEKIKPNSKKEIEKSAVKIIDNWKKQFGINNFSESISGQHIKDISSRNMTLCEMVKFCKERDLYPVVVIPVMYHLLSDYFTPDFKNKYMEPLLSNIDAPVLDYMNNSMNNDYRNFSTSLFLNKIGAENFTKVVLHDIEKIKKMYLQKQN